MPIGIAGNIERYEADDTAQFTFTASVSRPATVAFAVFNTDGRTLAPEAMQTTSFFVAESGQSTGLFYVMRVMPTSAGLYFGQWTAWDATSRTYTTRFEFEVMRTEAHSFFTYGDPMDVVRTGRQVFQRGDITMRDVRPYMESADAYIDSKLGMVMAVPVSPIPNIVRDMSKIFALGFYYSDRYAYEREGAPPGIVARMERYDEMLSAIMSGTAVLVTSGGVVTRAADEIGVQTGAISGGVPTFGMRDFEEQRVDPDIVQNERDRDS